MATHDKNYEKKVMIHNKKKSSALNYKSKISNQLKKQFEVVKGSESDEVKVNEGTDSDFTMQQSSSHRKRKSDTVTLEVPRKIFNNNEVVSMLDRTQTSSRKAVGVASMLLKSAGANLNDFTLSHRQVHRQRDKCRSVLAQQALDEFQELKPEHPVLHWDSKLIDDVHGTKHERLAVLVSGAPNYVEGKLLGVPSLVDDDGNVTSSGLAQFEGAKELVRVWDLSKSLNGLVFDTTASNSGVHQGACKRMEEWFGRPVFYFACRHHIGEVMAKDSWYELFEEDLSPDNAFFVEFKRKWSELDTTPDIATKMLNTEKKYLTDLKNKAKEFYHSILTKNDKNILPRDDYKTLAQTSLVILGGQLPVGHKFVWHKPGATHKARFMAFGIYANMMYSFSNQMDYDKDVMDALERFVQFFTLIYSLLS